MAGIPKEHDKLYFDKLIRTQKLESVLSLIHATYRAKLENPMFFEKNQIAQRLVNSYNLFRNNPKGQTSGAGTYTGDDGQFESQYTIGHEMCIWANSDLDLTEKAREVAENKITIRQYFDIFFFNYFQPVKNKNVHPLYSILSYMKQNETNEIDKDSIPVALGCEADNEIINGLCNFLDGTTYIKYSDKKLVVDSNKLDFLISKCNIRYIGEQGLDLAKKELDTDEKYAEYIMSELVVSGEQHEEIIELEDMNIEDLAKALNDMYNSKDLDKVLAIHLFGIKYGKLIRLKGYTPQTIVDKAGISASYFAELNKGIKLSGYVEYHPTEQETVVVVPPKSLANRLSRYPRNGKTNYLNTILYGAPGTGKTYSTIEYALSIIDNVKPKFNSYNIDQRIALIQRFESYITKGQICFTTFHQSYSYEDFIQGLRPDGEGSFKYFNGVFKNISEKALMDPSNDYVIIIDEINRGNISKVFGELITLLEDDKRFGEINGLSVVLPSGEKFVVPNNLYVVGTMNSADKSISLIDTALRRRFIFVEKPVDSSLISNSTLRAILDNINDYLKKELRSTDLLIGHSYFMNKSEEDIPEIFNYSIIPLLYEYFYDDQGKVIKTIESSNLTNSTLVKTGFGRVRIEKK